MSIDALIDTCLTMSYIKVRVFDGSARLHHSSELYLMNSLDTTELADQPAHCTTTVYKVSCLDASRHLEDVSSVADGGPKLRYMSDMSTEIDHYGLLRLCFGLTCLPFLAINTLYNIRMLQRAAAEILEYMHVDSKGISQPIE
ncbi:hypothetical protein T4D_4401 [Trichinella pseudospiralis]|uniref:Uncharacterized protein n=1 Tax=Trichinella pseudospiralis TaxID=6337 RepID=A0A0V1FE69_TRIPS|nr:hypothetical protein T4D_4401 [Trichinella pseudospiralis]